MNLVTNLTPEELAVLQTEMQDPALIRRKTRLFKEAQQPCFLLVPDSKMAVPVCFEEAEAPFEVRPLPGRAYGPVYNRDRTRTAQAKSAQPPAGVRPLPVSDSDMILKLADGSVVHGTTGCLGTTYRRLPERSPVG